MSGNTVQVCLQGTMCIAPMAPFITGNAAVSNTLTGQLIANVMYQWVRDTTDITGATSQTYALTSADVGHLVRVRMSFTDADNNFLTVTSKPVGPIQGAMASPVVYQNLNGSPALSSPVTTAMPTGVSSGDLLVSAAISPGTNAVFSAPPGWTIIDQVNNAALSAAYAFRVATGSGDAPTWSWSGGGQAWSNVLRFTGNSTTTPIGNHSINSGSGTTISGVPVTSAAGGTFHLDMLVANSQNIPLPSGWTETTNNTNVPAEHISHKDVGSAGINSGAPAVTISSAAWVALLVELRSQ